MDQYILIAMGLFSLGGAIANWGWFFNSRRGRFFVGIFGETGARIFYGVLGLILIGLAIL